MRFPVPLLTALFALGMTGAGVAQATLPNDDVNRVNNPGTVRDDTPVGDQALDCTCRNTAANAGDAATDVETIDCSCRKSVPDTTGKLAAPSPPKAAVPSSAGSASAPSH